MKHGFGLDCRKSLLGVHKPPYVDFLFTGKEEIFPTFYLALKELAPTRARCFTVPLMYARLVNLSLSQKTSGIITYLECLNSAISLLNITKAVLFLDGCHPFLDLLAKWFETVGGLSSALCTDS